MWAKIDAKRGVWKAPAGVETQLTGAASLRFQVEDLEQDQLNPLGVNCIPPEIVLPLIGELRRAAPDKAVVVYPNSGEIYRSEDNSWQGTTTPLQCERAAAEWIAAGANLVGGCCRIGPAQIAAMSQSVTNSG